MFRVILHILFLIIILCIAFKINIYNKNNSKYITYFTYLTEQQINKYNINHYNELETYLEIQLFERYNIYKKCNSSKIKCGTTIEGEKKSDVTSLQPHNYTIPFPLSVNIEDESNKPCKDTLLIIEIISKSSSFLERFAYRKIYLKYNFIQLYFAIGKSK